MDENKFLYRSMKRERYVKNAESYKNSYESLDKWLKKEYSEILQNLGDRAPECHSDFKALDAAQKRDLRQTYLDDKRGKIKENISELQREQAKEVYWNFKKDGVAFGDHGIARYIERSKRKDGTIKYNYQSIINMMRQPVNYISDRDGRHVRYYNRIVIITEPTSGEVVTIMSQNKLKKGYTKND